MIATLTAESEATTRDDTILKDLFELATHCSRSVRAAEATVDATLAHDGSPQGPESLTLTRHELMELSDQIGELEGETHEVCAIVASAVLKRRDLVGQFGFAPDAMARLTNLEPAAVDRLIRPIFEESGIADDFMPWRERFPEDGDPAIPDER